MKELKRKIEVAKSIIHVAEKKTSSEKICVAWSGGKDSTVLLHLIKTIHKNTIPYNVSFGDSLLEMEETYDFVKKLPLLWNFKLKHILFLTKNQAKNTEREHISKLLKTVKKNHALFERRLIKNNNIRVLLWGNRFQDRNNRQKMFMKKKGNTLFVYPLLHFTESDIWTYIFMNKIPYNKLYSMGYRHTNIALLSKKTSFLQKLWFQLIKVYFLIKIKRDHI